MRPTLAERAFLGPQIVCKRAKWAVRCKPALNAFAVTFGDRFPSAETY